MFPYPPRQQSAGVRVRILQSRIFGFKYPPPGCVNLGRSLGLRFKTLPHRWELNEIMDGNMPGPMLAYRKFLPGDHPVLYLLFELEV